MTAYSDLVTEHGRLTILRLLAEQPGYQANCSVLKDGLELYAVIRWSRDRVRSEVAWLSEQGLVKSRHVGGLVVAQLTQRGEDVAAGVSTVPGIKRPSPTD